MVNPGSLSLKDAKSIQSSGRGGIPGRHFDSCFIADRFATPLFGHSAVIYVVFKTLGETGKAFKAANIMLILGLYNLQD